MPHDAPDLPGLLDAVKEFVTEITPRLTGRDRYHALCSVYLLEIAQRELSEWEHQATADDARIRALTGAADGGAASAREARADLCALIRRGDFDSSLDQLHAELLAHVVDKVRVSKPDVLAELHRL